MSDNAIVTQGTVFKIGDGADPEAFSTVPEVMSFTGPGGSASVIDVTDLSSTAREKRMGLADEGTFSIEVNYIPQNTYHAQMRTDRSNRTLRNFKLVFADTPNTTYSFSGFITEFATSGGVDDVLKASVTIEISGSVTES